MAKRGRPRKSDSGSHKADATGLDIGIRPEDAVKDEAAAERAEFMKKKADAEKAQRAAREVVNYHYEVLGGRKLIKKVKKANGSVHSFYIGRVDKNAELLNDPEIKAHLK